MPQSPSAIKRVRSDAKRYARNTAALTEIKTLKRNFRIALARQGKNEDQSLDKKVDVSALGQKLIARSDAAARKGIIPKGRANRIKARTARALAAK